MLGQAISKVKNEMDKNKDDQYIQVIGSMLLKQLEVNPKVADKIIAGEKTIAKSIDAMAQEAKKKQKGGRAILTDAEGFAINCAAKEIIDEIRSKLSLLVVWEDKFKNQLVKMFLNALSEKERAAIKTAR